ncbi:hypothetical protein LI328DRAFT_155564 [Trichoderma asperelloides]|nr:hypothetical protein LI328DRAFT_155564 [Trichoderma asperelloides]
MARFRAKHQGRKRHSKQRKCHWVVQLCWHSFRAYVRIASFAAVSFILLCFSPFLASGMEETLTKKRALHCAVFLVHFRVPGQKRKDKFINWWKRRGENGQSKTVSSTARYNIASQPPTTTSKLEHQIFFYYQHHGLDARLEP